MKTPLHPLLQPRRSSPLKTCPTVLQSKRFRRSRLAATVQATSVETPSSAWATETQWLVMYFCCCCCFNFLLFYDLQRNKQLTSFPLAVWNTWIFFRAPVASRQEPEKCATAPARRSDGEFCLCVSLGGIPVTASAAVMEAALNSLWSIKPDSVQVTKREDSQRSHFTVTFNSKRGKRKHTRSRKCVTSLWLLNPH